MKKIEKDLKDIEIVEKILIKCYGKHGKAALINSSDSFNLTIDGKLILNCLSLTPDNYLYKMIVKSVDNHSNSYGDNSKTFFIYIVELLKRVHLSNRPICEPSTFRNISLTVGVWQVVEILSEQFPKSINSTDQLILTSRNDYLEAYKSASVLNDLNALNKNLCRISNRLINDLIDSCFSNLTIDQMEHCLHNILSDMGIILTWSSRNNLENSKLFYNGFLLNSKSGFHNLSSQIKAIFMVNSAEIDEVKHVNLQTNKIQLICDSRIVVQFSRKFLDSIKSEQINLLLIQGSINDTKKQQLNSINCSYVCYLEKEFIDHVCTKLGKQPIVSNESICDQNCLLIESIQLVDDENRYFFKLDEIHRHANLSFVYFCSPIKAIFNQFKINFIKMIKTFIQLHKEPRIAIKVNTFEHYMEKLLANLMFGHSDKLSVLFKLLSDFFSQLNLAFNFHVKLDNEQRNFYEPLSLKLANVYELLSFIQHFEKIDYSCDTSNLPLLKNKNA